MTHDKQSERDKLADALNLAQKLQREHSQLIQPEKGLHLLADAVIMLKTSLDEARAELAGYHQLKLIGTDGCRTCENGRVSMYLVSDGRCISCAPAKYEPRKNERAEAAEKERDQLRAENEKLQKDWVPGWMHERVVSGNVELHTENDRLRKSLSCVGVHTCFDGCEHPLCLMRKGRDELRDQRELDRDNYNRLLDSARIKDKSIWELRAENKRLETVRSNYEYEQKQNREEIERLKADCAHKDRTLDCIDEALAESPGSDLLAELHALREVAEEINEIDREMTDCGRCMAIYDKLKEKK